MALIDDKRRQTSKLTTPQVRSYKSSCAVVIHRYDNVDITKIVNINVTNDKQFAGKAQASASENLKPKSPLVIRQDIVQCLVNNDKSGIGGSFTVVVKKGKEFKNGQNTNKDVPYLKSINPGDWITIYMKRTKEISDKDLSSASSDSGLKMIGIIETVRQIEIDDANSGQPRLEFIISGRSFGKVFDTNVFANPVVNQAAIQQVLGADFLTGGPDKVIKPLADNTPDSVIRKLAQFYLGSRGVARRTANEAWYVPQSVAQLLKGNDKNKSVGRSFIDVLDLKTRIQPLPGAALFTTLPSTGTIWSILQFFQNQAANEMYTELVKDGQGNLKPALILRQVPFSNKRNQETSVFTANLKYTKSNAPDDASDFKSYFTDLPRLSIVSTDIRQKNIGKSDHERINYVIVTPRIFDATKLDFEFVAGSNPPSIQRYGLKTFQTETSYVLGGKVNNNDGIKSACSRIVSLLEDWFFLAHNLYNGTLLVDGVDGFVEAGSNLYIKDIQHLFHIEGYTHSYRITNSGSEYTTEFRVSRGQRFDATSNLSSFIGDSNVDNDTNTVVTSFVARGTK